MLKLSVAEKIQLIEDLIASVNNEIEENDKDELIAIANERYQAYLKNPQDGISWEELKQRMNVKYGFLDEEK